MYGRYLVFGFTGFASVSAYLAYNRQFFLPTFQMSMLDENPTALVVVDQKLKLPEELNIPKYKLNTHDMPDEFKAFKDSSALLVKKIDGETEFSAFDDHGDAKVERWLDLLLNPMTEIENVQDFDLILRKRKQRYMLDSVVMAYAETDEDLQNYKEIIDDVNFKDMTAMSLLPGGKTHLKFYYTRDIQVATALGLERGVVYRYRDPRGLFDCRLPKSSYTSRDKMNNYLQEHLSQSYTVNGHTFQRLLGILRDQYLIHDQPASKPYVHVCKNKLDLSRRLASVDPLITPVFSIKDLQMVAFNVARTLAMNRKTQQLLIVSIDKSKEEIHLGDLNTVMSKLKLHEFARTHPEIKIIVGFPEYLYKLPIKEFALYHFDDLEVRLVDVENFEVVKQYVYEEGTLEEFLENKEEGAYPETGYPYTDQNAQILSPDEYWDVMNGDKCYFVMNCSKDCGACSMQMPYFMQAAGKNDTGCTFAKYRTETQSPYFKGPNATPTYFLHTGKPGAEPLKYPGRELGVSVDAFINFVKDNKD